MTDRMFRILFFLAGGDMSTDYFLFRRILSIFASKI